MFIWDECDTLENAFMEKFALDHRTSSVSGGSRSTRLIVGDSRVALFHTSHVEYYQKISHIHFVEIAADWNRMECDVCASVMRIIWISLIRMNSHQMRTNDMMLFICVCRRFMWRPATICNTFDWWYFRCWEVVDPLMASGERACISSIDPEYKTDTYLLSKSLLFSSVKGPSYS